MRMCGLATLLFGLAAWPAPADETCLSPEALIRLDGEWERALLQSDVERLGTLLAEDFIWVHNHASAVDTRTSILDRAGNPDIGTAGSARSRTRSNVEARILGSTGVVTGFTLDDRGSAKTRYNFMRTYSELSDRCLLLANHTMAVPEDAR